MKVEAPEDVFMSIWEYLRSDIWKKVQSMSDPSLLQDALILNLWAVEEPAEFRADLGYPQTRLSILPNPQNCNAWKHHAEHILGKADLRYNLDLETSEAIGMAELWSEDTSCLPSAFCVSREGYWCQVPQMAFGNKGLFSACN